MNKKALYAVMLAALLPLASYFIVKKYSETAAKMPPHYFPDVVLTDTVNGKESTDTLWRQLRDFSFVNQLNEPISWKDMSGKIVVIDFFFTHCPMICPRMTANMRQLQQSIHNGQRVGDKTNKKVHFLSITIDAASDSVEQLKKWADRFQVDPEQWWLLTGNKDSIYDFATKELMVGIMDKEGIVDSFFHTQKFILVDTNRYVRGFYDGLDSVDLKRLSSDIVLLTLEKDPKKKGFLAGKLQMLAVVVLVAIIAVGFFLFMFQKKKNNVTGSMEKK